MPDPTSITNAEDAVAHPATLATSAESMRSTTKWLMASLGAIGAVLVAGSQLSNLGATDVSTSSFWWALSGLVIALSAVVAALAVAARVLTPTRFGIGQLARAGAPRQKGELGFEARERRELQPIVAHLDRQPDLLLGRDSVAAVYEERETLVAQALEGEASDDLIADLESNDMLARDLTELAQFEVVRRRFRHAVAVLWPTAVIGALGITLFAWATTSSSTAVDPPVTGDPDRSPVRVVVVPVDQAPVGSGRVDMDPGLLDALDQLSVQLTDPEALRLITDLIGTGLDQGGETRDAFSRLGDQLIESVGNNIVQPIIERGLDRLFGPDGAPAELPAGWTQIVQVDTQVRLEAQGIEPETAADLAALLTQSLARSMATVIPTASSSALINGPTVYIINQSNGTTQVIPEPTG